MACHHTVLAQILKLVPRHEFEKEARLHHKGRKLRKMTRWSLARVNAEQPWELYEAMFGRLLARCQGRGGGMGFDSRTSCTRWMRPR